MHPARSGIYMPLQGIGISRFELGQLPPVKHPPRQVMLGCQIFENIGTGGIGPCLALFPTRQGELVKQDLAQLLGAGNIEHLTSQLMNFGLILRHFLSKGMGHARQGGPVHRDSGHLHILENRNQGALQRFINAGDMDAVKLWFEG